MVLLVGGMFGASFQRFCLCRRPVVQAVRVPSNILCTAGQALDSSGKYAAAQNTITIHNATKNTIDMRKKSLVSILFHRLHI